MPAQPKKLMETIKAAAKAAVIESER